MNSNESVAESSEIVLPEFGSIELLDHYGDDLGVVNAARVSYGKESQWEYELDKEVTFGFNLFGELSFLGEGVPGKRKLSDKDKGLLNYLFKHNHPSPLRHNGFTWRIKAPIFVVREIQKHVIATAMNEVSLRYSEAEEEFYIPAVENVRTQVGKPGDYYYEQIDPNDAFSGLSHLKDSYEYAWDTYQKLLKLGWAKEQARMVLPVGVYSTIWFSGNANCMLNFFALRSESDAQKEIQLYSQAMEKEFKKIMPETYEAWNNNGRGKL